MTLPKISIVTVVLNRKDYLRRAVECVLFQDYPNFEHIVIDGGSTDGTVDVLKEYPHLRWISEPDGGSVFALNKGLKMISGDIWGWLNSDEYYFPGVFKLVSEYFGRHPEWDLIYGSSDYVDSDDKFLGHRRSRPFNAHRLLIGFNQIAAPSSMFMRCRALQGVGGQVDVRWQHTYDLDLWIRVSKAFVIHDIPERVSRFGIHPDSGVAKAPQNAIEEVANLRRHHGGESRLLDRLFWVPFFDAFLWVYMRLKWRRMVAKSSMAHADGGKVPK